MLYSEAQLNDKKFFHEIKIKSQVFIDADQFREAYDMAKQLEQSIDAIKDFKESNYELYKAYKEIIIILKWVGLPIMTEEMVAHYFQYYFTWIFKIDWYDYSNLWRKLSTVLLVILDYNKRDQYKKSLIQALLNNQEIITSKKISINNQVKNPTVANWLQDYFSVLGTGKVNKLARTQYLVNSVNTKNLSEQERGKVKLLFDLYERLKLSSLTLEGLEEEIPVNEDGIKGIIIEGVFEPYKEEKIDFVLTKKKPIQPIKSEIEDDIAELRGLAASYPNGSFERKAVEEEIERLTNLKK
jgi:hypothetical protein